jgi:hypothetical protein
MHNNENIKLMPLCLAPFPWLTESQAPRRTTKVVGPPCQPAIVRIDLRPVAGWWGSVFGVHLFPWRTAKTEAWF